jgi:hypothetical protein
VPFVLFCGSHIFGPCFRLQTAQKHFDAKDHTYQTENIFMPLTMGRSPITSCPTIIERTWGSGISISMED